MKFTNIGGATAIVEHNGKRMLFDPWLDDGIMHGAWFHYPPLNVKLEDIGHLDYIFISHIHEDHCSAGTIKHLNKDAEIIICDRNPNFVLNFLIRHDFHFKKIHLIKPKVPQEIFPGLIVDMLEADPQHEISARIDSMLILKWDEFVLFNANDTALYQDAIEYLKLNYPKIDLALLPYAGGSGYPSCFSNLSNEEKMRERDRIMHSRLNDFIENIKKINPVRVMPFADQYVVAGSRSYLNKFLSHPPGLGVVQEVMQSHHLESKSLFLNSGQTFDFDTQVKIPDQDHQKFNEFDREKYIENHLKTQKYDFEHFELNAAVAINRLIQHARNRLWEEQKRTNYYPQFSYYLEVTDWKQRFRIDFTSEKIEEHKWEENLIQPYLRIGAKSSLMALLLIGHISWNIADGSLFLDYERVPNVYDTKIFACINYFKI